MNLKASVVGVRLESGATTTTTNNVIIMLIIIVIILYQLFFFQFKSLVILFKIIVDGFWDQGGSVVKSCCTGNQLDLFPEVLGSTPWLNSLAVLVDRQLVCLLPVNLFQ